MVRTPGDEGRLSSSDCPPSSRLFVRKKFWAARESQKGMDLMAGALALAGGGREQIGVEEGDLLSYLSWFRTREVEAGS